ncbi:hypothetical protein BCON_0002g00360 [Botryotinia convoluta]|uniref:Uncharacterized protein n=1 Tax=Botryotinia convoluta TaxID=54673 RepID=A0A4Z1IXH8_9HELO|nr:hypothetical protein BCON_0002g00360 [Botryotinia convoluta]
MGYSICYRATVYLKFDNNTNSRTFGFGLTAEIFGPRFALNASLFICARACIVSRALLSWLMASWNSLAFVIILVGFGSAGTLIL